MRRNGSRRLATVALVAAGLLMLAWKSVDWVPLPDLVEVEGLAVEWVDREGRTLRATAARDGAWRVELGEGGIPERVMRCTLAAEDARFLGHAGVDVLATGRAAWQWVRSGRVVSGASTITQQLVKLGHRRPRTMGTKVIEALQAIRLEREWGKDRILRAYLASVEYGNRVQGLGAAARHYFGKAPGDLSWGEAALLAGLPQAPSRLNPRKRFEKAKARQEWILGRCEALGWMSSEEAARARAETMELMPAGGTGLAPHFVEMVRSRLGRRVAGRVVTTLDLGLQEFCEGLVRARLAGMKGLGVRDAALVVIENRTGEVRAWVGSPDWGRAGDGQVDGVLARRSPGSAVKPFAYLRAIEGGATAAEVIADVPMRVATPTGIYEPRNYDGRFRGPVSLREALAGSLNIPAVRVLERMGGAGKLLGTLEGFGVTTGRREATGGGLGVVLGDLEVRLVDLANAYATLARQGWWLPWRVTSGDGEAGRRVAEPGACWLVADILSDPVARAPEFGMHSVLSPGVRVACKTGTSTGFRDNWAVGFTPAYTVGVWVGNFDGSPMLGVSGVSGAAPIFADVMLELERRHGAAGWFAEPSGLRRVRVDAWTGRRPRGGQGGREEVFLEGQDPGWETEWDRDASGRVILGEVYQEWLKQAGGVGDAGPDAAGTFPVVISPVPGTRYWLDADAAPGTQRIALRASGATSWRSETLRLVGGEGWVEAVLEVGRHELHAEGRGGNAGTWIEVRRR